MKLPSPQEIKAFFPGIRICLIKTFLLLVAAILKGRSSSLYRCADEIAGPGTFNSKYKRFLRLVATKNQALLCACVTRLMVAYLEQDDPVELVIDRTNWKLGTEPINLLFVGALIDGGIYVPLVWEALPKNGSSSQHERIALLKRFRVLWPDEQRRFVLLADREFVGRTWVQWLHEHHFELVIRLKREDYFADLALSGGYKMKQIQRAVKKKGSFCHQILIDGCPLYYTALPCESSDDGLLFLLSSRPDALWAGATYRRRWKIEVCFRHMKTNGFNLEDTHLVGIDRLQVLIAAVSLAYVVAIRQGLIAQKKKPIAMKRSRGKAWRSKSVFRYGCSHLKQKAETIAQIMIVLLRFLQASMRKPRAPVLANTKSVQ